MQTTDKDQNRYTGAAWHDRFLPRLTSEQVLALPKEKALVVLPIGAVEQHGPHLPLFTDTLIGEGLIHRAFEYLPQDARVWLLPPIPYGKSNEHLLHAGTISLSAQTLMSMLIDIGHSVKRAGFSKLLLFNTHGGNTDLLHMMAREVRITCELDVFRKDAGGLGMGEGIIEAEELRFGLHGGDLETSIVRKLQEQWVNMEKAPCEFPNFPESHLALENLAYAWVMDDLSVSGTTGNATLATREKGEAVLDQGAQMIAQTLQEMAAFEMSSIRVKPESR